MLCGASAKGIRIRRQLNQPKNKFFSSANMRHQNNMISRINLLWVRWVLRCRCTRMPACCSNSGTEHRTRIHFSLMRPHYLLHYICGVAFLCRHFPLTSKMICGHWMPSSHVFASLLFHNIFFLFFFSPIHELGMACGTSKMWRNGRHREEGEMLWFLVWLFAQEGILLWEILMDTWRYDYYYYYALRIVWRFGGLLCLYDTRYELQPSYTWPLSVPLAIFLFHDSPYGAKISGAGDSSVLHRQQQKSIESSDRWHERQNDSIIHYVFRNRLIFSRHEQKKKRLSRYWWMAWPTMWCYFRIELRIIL